MIFFLSARTFNDYDLLCKEIETQCTDWGFLIKDIQLIICGCRYVGRKICKTVFY